MQEMIESSLLIVVAILSTIDWPAAQQRHDKETENHVGKNPDCHGITVGVTNFGFHHF